MEQVEPTPWVSSVTFLMKPNREVASGSFRKTICIVYTKAISQQTRYRRMQENTCTGQVLTLTLKTSQGDARNVSSGLRLPRSLYSLMTYQRARGGNWEWIISTLMATLMF